MSLKELQKFPDNFLFKIVGDNNEKFIASVHQVFDSQADASFSEKVSGGGKYISISVRTELWKYEELEELYKKISKLEGLKFYV